MFRYNLSDSFAERPRNKSQPRYDSVTLNSYDKALVIYADVGLSKVEEVSVTIGSADYQAILGRMLVLDREATIKAIATALLKEEKTN